MKNTYLIYKEIDGTRQLVAATQEEWDAIMKANKGLLIEERRCFIKDCFVDGNELDCMYIEVPVNEFRKWNRENTNSQRKRQRGLLYRHLSLNAGVPDTEVDSLHECIPSDFNLEEIAEDHILMEELRNALRKWKPWAEEMLEIYMKGEKRISNSLLCNKYNRGERAIQKRKQAFEKFVLNFLKK